MALSIDDIYRIAKLSRLELSSTEATNLEQQLNGFFNMVEQMQAVNTDGVEPLAHPVASIQDVVLRLRDDVVREPNQREANQQNAPAVADGLFLVPRVIE